MSRAEFPKDQRHAGCECKSGVESFGKLVETIELAQSEYKAQWAAMEETAQLLASFGWKDGIDVMDEYGISTYDEKDPYKLSWVVQESIYLATGHGTIGDLNGGIQEGDWFVNDEPLIDDAIKYLLANPRAQRTELNVEQVAQLRESFEMACHMHLHFHAPMWRLYTIHEKLGAYASSIAIPQEVTDALYDWLLGVRESYTTPKFERTATTEANDLLAIIADAQPCVKKRLSMVDSLFERFEKKGFEGDTLRKKVQMQLDWAVTYHNNLPWPYGPKNAPKPSQNYDEMLAKLKAETVN